MKKILKYGPYFPILGVLVVLLSNTASQIIREPKHFVITAIIQIISFTLLIGSILIRIIF